MTTSATTGEPNEKQVAAVATKAPAAISSPSSQAGKSTVISRLGRGLGSLIPAAAPATVVIPAAIEKANPMPSIPTVVKASERSTGNTPSTQPAARTPDAGSSFELELSFIARNTRQPREKFDERAIEALAESIRQHGLIQPVVVRKLKLPVGGKTHELIAGERRFRAFERLAKLKIPVIIRDASEADSAVLALIENVQREDLNPIERAVALKRLMADFSWTQQQAAERVGLDRASVANLLRLIDLDPFTAGCVREGRLTQGHAKALLAIESVPARRALAERALHDEWSVRQVEREVQRIKSASGLATPAPPETTVRRGSAQIGDLEKRLGQFIGSKIRIKRGRKTGTGTLSISFYSLDQFDGILHRLGFDPNSLKD